MNGHVGGVHPGPTGGVLLPGEPLPTPQALTDASKAEHSCGHGDVLVRQIVQDRNLWRQHPAPMAGMAGEQERDLGLSTHGQPLDFSLRYSF